LAKFGGLGIWESESLIQVMSYAYDPSGIRRSHEEVEGPNRKRTEYLIDPNQDYAQVLEEWGANGPSASALTEETLGKIYIFGDDLISQTEVALDGIATNSFYHYDGLGTTRALSDASGSITDRYSYTAFGENDEAGTSGNTSGATDNNYKYTGEQLDTNLGFYYLRARYMNPNAGRFVSQDSYLGNSMVPISLHKYLYSDASPSNYTDPSGCVTLMELGHSIALMTSLTLTSSAAILYVGGQMASEDSDWIPDGAIATLSVTGSAGASFLEVGADFVYEFRSGKAYSYGFGGLGFGPLSLFKLMMPKAMLWYTVTAKVASPKWFMTQPIA
jgi:RHS repeat-associated protein